VESNLQLDGVFETGELVGSLKMRKRRGGFEPDKSRRFALSEAKLPAVKPDTIGLGVFLVHNYLNFLDYGYTVE